MGEPTPDSEHKPTRTPVLKKQLPFKLVSTASWAQQVADKFKCRWDHGSWIYSGTCPRCGHETSMVVPKVPVYELDVPRRDRPESVHFDRLTVHCSCEPGHKAGLLGCGAFGDVLDVTFGGW
jgi:hypothetical protein